MSSQPNITLCTRDQLRADTKLRTYWNLIDDAVYELKMEPANRGGISFQP